MTPDERDAIAAQAAHGPDTETILALIADVDRAEHDRRNAVFLYQAMRDALREYFGGDAQAAVKAELLLRELSGVDRKEPQA